MSLTAKQAHVLANLERVGQLPYKLAITGQRQRFVLDGHDCTLQVVALLVRRRIRHAPYGVLVRQ